MPCAKDAQEMRDAGLRDDGGRATQAGKNSLEVAVAQTLQSHAVAVLRLARDSA